MKQVGVCLIFMSACLATVPAAWAVWGGFIPTGNTTGIGNPSCAQVAANSVVCAVQSGTNAMMVNQFNGSSWGTWKSLPGGIVSAPSCTSDGAGHVICGAVASNGNLQVSTFTGSWSKPVKIKASLYSAPSCAEYAAGQVLCVARNSANNLAWSLYNGTSWSAFATLSTTAISNPSCTTDNNSGVICAVFTTGYNTLVNRFTAGAWESPTNINISGIAGGQPDCASINSAGNVACFAKAWNSGIYGSRYNGNGWAQSNWSAYASISGEVDDNAGCTSQTAGLLVCGATAIDNAFYGNVYNGSGWVGWTKVVGATVVGTPSCAALGGGQVVCTVMGTDNKLTSVVGP